MCPHQRAHLTSARRHPQGRFLPRDRPRYHQTDDLAPSPRCGKNRKSKQSRDGVVEVGRLVFLRDALQLGKLALHPHKIVGNDLLTLPRKSRPERCVVLRPLPEDDASLLTRTVAATDVCGLVKLLTIWDLPTHAPGSLLREALLAAVEAQRCRSEPRAAFHVVWNNLMPGVPQPEWSKDVSCSCGSDASEHGHVALALSVRPALAAPAPAHHIGTRCSSPASALPSRWRVPSSGRSLALRADDCWVGRRDRARRARRR